MKHLLRLITGILFLAGSHALLDVLAGGPSFYGRAKVHLSNGADKDPTIISCDIAVLSGNLRLESDSFEPGANLPPAEAAQVKQMHSVSILRPDRNRMYMVFPSVKSYIELAYSKSTGTDPAPPPKIDKTPLGTEVVGDQPCAKVQMDVTESNGEHYDITTWTATNSSTLPIQIKVGSPSALVELQDLHFEAPDSGIFEPPAGYTKYEGMQELIQRDIEKAQKPPSQ